MINNIAYYPLQCARNSVPVLDRFLSSCRSAGIKPVPDSMDCDAAIIWSVLWHGRMAKNKEVYEHYRAQGKPVIVIDVGALQRDITWKIAINNINAEGYYGHQHNLDKDRPRKLGIQLQPFKQNRGNKIVIATQHGKSQQVANIDMDAWVDNTIREIYKYTNEHLCMVRHHPRWKVDYDNVEMDHPHKIPGTYDSFDIDFNVHTMVNYNSGPGIQGAIAGCPVLVDPTSLAYPVSINVKDINSPPEVDREDWFIKICHTEYTLDEIEAGLWLKRLSDNLVK